MSTSDWAPRTKIMCHENGLALIAERDGYVQAYAVLGRVAIAALDRTPAGLEQAQAWCDAHMQEPPNVVRSVREAARLRKPLDGADAQALEGAVSLTERERDEARTQLAQVERERNEALTALAAAQRERDEARSIQSQALGRTLVLARERDDAARRATEQTRERVRVEQQLRAAVDSDARAALCAVVDAVLLYVPLNQQNPLLDAVKGIRPT